MKTLKKDNEIVRVDNEKAEQMIKDKWEYCKRSLWKTLVRDKDKKVKKEEAKEEGKSDKSKYKAKKEREKITRAE